MRIIIDTNLWISFTIGKRLSSLKSLLKNKRIEIYVCKELLSEYEDVVQRPKLDKLKEYLPYRGEKYIKPDDITATLEVIDLYCYNVEIKEQAFSSIRDVKDLYLLSLADTVRANYIVSGDKDLLVLKKHNNTDILDFNTFIRML